MYNVHDYIMMRMCTCVSDSLCSNALWKIWNFLDILQKLEEMLVIYYEKDVHVHVHVCTFTCAKCL